MIETEIWTEKEGWNVHVIWGFAIVAGKRHYVRKAIVSKVDKIEKNLKFVYDRL